MFKNRLIIAFVAFIAIVSAADEPTRTSAIETAPGIVCPMTVCPTNTLDKRAPPACPASCPDNCRIIDDLCCPGVQKAICSPSSASSSADTSSSIPTSTAISSVTPSASVSGSASISVSSVPVSSAVVSHSGAAISSSPASSPKPSPASSTSAANTIKLTMSSSVIAVLIAAGFQYF
ncbi:hypothetical protein G6F57_000886 [Rhizopus arrhizus]|uniref:Uncharacterized protein n=1 Tax=Rhizopus oryzae TaxID=64495 RepID=A0A9P6XKD9_RHIOR|nr:hypothetical protein G6F23_005014 [Rhizopus arrhizus]KAG1416527.1 hypothetical protein G6F58_005933 [Rhizopus delemar]KAG0765027.1 hypothetical protein G6F24_004748 [Rhizopus arrhizus]KAG0797161.1 hypothetical protein G6F21_000731 [Rhizopus arrhizus]KAG0799431.1 hypothetical protein G6F22_003236 [Rhizopus arrhizus]